MIDDETALRYIAINVRTFMEMKRLSQSDLARLAGENHVFVSNLLKGKSMPGAVKLKRVANALDVSFEQLLCRPAEKFLQSS